MARSTLAGAGAALLSLAYMLSIGPVYYVWARCSAEMDLHEHIEAFYSPVLHRGPPWLRTQLTDYRDVARIAGHQTP